MTRTTAGVGIPGAWSLSVVLVALSVLGCDERAGGASGGPSTRSAPEAPTALDVEPFLASLRPTERARAATPATAALPSYDLEIALGPAPGTALVRETVIYTHSGEAPLASLELLIPANDPAPPGQGPVRLRACECVGAPCQVGWDRASTITVTPGRPVMPGQRLAVRLELAVGSRRSEAPLLGAVSAGSPGLPAEARADAGLPLAAGLHEAEGLTLLADLHAIVGPGAGRGPARSSPPALVRARIVGPPGVARVSAGSTVGGRTRLDADGRPAEHVEEVVIGPGRRFGLAVVPGYAREESARGDLALRVWFPPARRDEARAVLAAAGEALGVLEARLGPFPYAELDLVLAPALPGDPPAFPGLSVLPRAGASEPAELDVALALGRQYFGALLAIEGDGGCLEEGFATLGALLYVHDRYGVERAGAIADTQLAGRYHRMRALGHLDAPAATALVDPSLHPIRRAGLLRGKCAYFPWALRAELGDAGVLGPLRRVLEDHGHGTVSATEVREALATGPTADAVRASARRWLEEAHGDVDLPRPLTAPALDATAAERLLEDLGRAAQRTLAELPLAPPGRAPSDDSPEVRAIHDSAEELRRAFDTLETDGP